MAANLFVGLKSNGDCDIPARMKSVKQDGRKQIRESDHDQLELGWADAIPVSARLPPLFAAPPRLPVDPQERGYSGFVSERETALRALEQRFGLILNKRVRLTLREVPGAFTGKLMLADLIPGGDDARTVRLSLDRMEFVATDIESCVLLD